MSLRFRACSLLVLILIGACTACSGGSRDVSENRDGGSGGGNRGEKPEGRVWFKDIIPYGWRGAQYFSFSKSKAVFLFDDDLSDEDPRLSVAPHGDNYYLIKNYDEYATIHLYSTKSVVDRSGADKNDPVESHRVPGHWSEIKVSPIDQNIIMADWSEDLAAPVRKIIYNLASQSIIGAWNNVAMAWRSDGSWVQVHGDGQYKIGQGRSPSSTGSLKIPDGYTVGLAIDVNPQNKSTIALTLWESNAGASDVYTYIADLNSEEVYQYSNHPSARNPLWSPDGKFLKFSADVAVDPASSSMHVIGGVALGGPGCYELYGPSEARGIGLIDMKLFNPPNSSYYLTCGIISWSN